MSPRLKSDSCNEAALNSNLAITKQTRTRHRAENSDARRQLEKRDPVKPSAGSQTQQVPKRIPETPTHHEPGKMPAHSETPPSGPTETRARPDEAVPVAEKAAQ